MAQRLDLVCGATVSLPEYLWATGGMADVGLVAAESEAPVDMVIGGRRVSES